MSKASSSLERVFAMSDVALSSSSFVGLDSAAFGPYLPGKSRIWQGTWAQCRKVCIFRVLAPQEPCIAIQ